MIPTTVSQLLITLVLVIPGFVFQETRIRMRGRRPNEVELTNRLLRAIAASTIFALVYLMALGPLLSTAYHDPTTLLSHPRRAAGVAFLAAFVVPALAAVLPQLRTLSRQDWAEIWETKSFRSLTRYDTTPSAWDVAFNNVPPTFVRVRMRDGSWFAGWFGTSSYASSYPDPQGLYVEVEHAVNAQGAIGEPINGSGGAFIDCTDAVLVELLHPAPDPDTGTDTETVTATSTGTGRDAGSSGRHRNRTPATSRQCRPRIPRVPRMLKNARRGRDPDPSNESQ